MVEWFPMPMSRMGILLASSTLAFASACTGEDLASDSDASSQPQDANPAAADAAVNRVDGGLTTPDATVASGCSPDALQLIALVNDYRAENALAAIPASTSLCTVGDAHVDDLITNAPDAQSSCNMHSWSDQGAWSPCCYTSDHAQAQCMWDKPRELTAYTGNGYENAAGGGGTISPTQALNLWKNSSGHNAVILNQGIWANQDWKALGAGLRDGRAVLWFGSAVDPAQQ